MKLRLALLIAVLAVSSVALADDPPVQVHSTYVNNGHGIVFYADNYENKPVCVFPYIESQSNVYGSLGGRMFQLSAGETNVNIGSFNQADSTQDWAVNIATKYGEGSCTDF